MSESGLSNEELETFYSTMRQKMSNTDSIGGLENWLKSQPFVKSVQTAKYLIKTEPPKKEVTVIFKMKDGSSVSKVIDIVLFPDQSMGLAGVHDI